MRRARVITKNFERQPALRVSAAEAKVDGPPRVPTRSGKHNDQ